ncbi:hypothetical protein BGW36DRAFT_331149 [Talaromyces proteolyticus]|uniref:Zn(2)-C6 fungal-type domain-containing protein n=1 Tax=Talaromyces proteolyticus TaxID=1131652 RepID=A0AAD4PSE6_9EURO|nr:uncharacterized protein BGW36DRAFT_331149 [Talaromyces proteolyticus]KAH8688725.1 hypothetical protein BGW36DRAFT_331149 [Talaromyces proteolyticus]
MRGRKRNFVACVHCRQMKLACDGLRKFPAACSRCTKAGRLCSVDPSFKRVKKREQLEAAQRELQDIKRSLKGHEHGQEPSDNSPSTRVTPYDSFSSLRSEIHISDSVFTSKTIGGAEISADLIRDLSMDFSENYHRQCPFLPPFPTFLEYSEACPLLLHTILVISLGGKPEHVELFSKVVDSVRTMSYDSMKPEHLSLQSMQALLLLCYWPLPYSKRIEDPLHSFIAIATHMGYRLGLHRPSHFAMDFENKTLLDGNIAILGRITWAVCFIMNVSVTSQLGLPTTIRLDRGLLEILAAKPDWLPDTLYYQLHISRQAFNIASTLEDCGSLSNDGLSSDQLPVIRVFDTELKALEYRFSTSWSLSDHLTFLGCRMMLYTLALTAISESLENDDRNHVLGVESPSHWVTQGYLTAIATIRTAASMRDKLLTSPTRLHKLLMNAVCYLLLLKCSRYQDLVVSTTLSSGISQGWNILRGLSITPGDFTSRACLILERLARYSEMLQPQDRTNGLLVLKSRMGANIAFSTALRTREFSRKIQHYQASSESDTIEQHADNLGIEDQSFSMESSWEDLFLDMEMWTRSVE